ncbi:protein kinase [Endozoicomonas sp. OPT23]|uniref:protein kinase domain-containing protein n=1 Tax=Endozoicomonas sp. OPT23 TaxID=2072845 RepID=UPI0018917C72|nr:protein kinase [Endozoicomonas sp. OPT23]
MDSGSRIPPANTGNNTGNNSDASLESVPDAEAGSNSKIYITELDSFLNSSLTDSSSSSDSGVGSSIGSRTAFKLSTAFPPLPFDIDSLATGKMVGSGSYSSVYKLTSDGKATNLVFKTLLEPEESMDHLPKYWEVPDGGEVQNHQSIGVSTEQHIPSDDEQADDWLPESLSPSSTGSANSGTSDFQQAPSCSPLHSKEFAALQQAGNHPNIVQCYGELILDDSIGLVFEQVSGPSLDELINALALTFNNQPLDAGDAEEKRKLTSIKEYWGCIQKLAHQTCSVLSHIHQQNLVHCDLKPDNLLISQRQLPDSTDVEPDYSLKLIDFGLASTTGEHAAVGHELYADPVAVLKKMQGLDTEISPVIDSYALGVILSDAFHTYHPSVMRKRKGARFDKYIKSFTDAGGHFKGQPLPRTPKNAPPLITQNRLDLSHHEMEPDAEARQAINYFGQLVNELTTSHREQRLTASEALKHPFFQTVLINQEDFNKIIADIPERKQHSLKKIKATFKRDYPNFPMT